MRITREMSNGKKRMSVLCALKGKGPMTKGASSFHARCRKNVQWQNARKVLI